MRVAFSKIKLTPKNYIGKSLAGYTRKDPCLGKLDDIYAYAVLIDGTSEATKKSILLLISIDTLKIPLSISKYIKKKISSNHPKLDSEHILIHATHTHASFDLTGEFYKPGGTFNVMKGIMFGANRNDSYIVWFARKIIKMVKELFNKLKPCIIASKKEKFNPDIVINRRHPTSNTKPHLGVITFKSLDTKELVGIIVNYACHPTTLSYKNNKLSADYPGRIIHKIEELTNGRINTIYFNGPSGDLNPITTCGIDYPKLEVDKSLIYDQLGTYEDTIRIGNSIAEAALKLANSISEEDYFDSIEIQPNTKYIWIPMKDYKYISKLWLKNKLIFALKKYFLLMVARVNILNSNFPIFILNKKILGIKCKTLIQNIKIKISKKSKSKEFSILTIPGELFEDIGKFLYRYSITGIMNTYIFQNTQDWIAYLFPLKEYINEGGYEPIPSFSPICGYYIKNEMRNLINDIKKI